MLNLSSKMAILVIFKGIIMQHKPIKTFLLILLSLSFGAKSAWGAFIVLTPASKMPDGISISFEYLKHSDKFKIVLIDELVKTNRDIVMKSAWLVLTTNGLKDGEHHLGSFLLSDQKYGNKNIVLTSRIGEQFAVDDRPFVKVVIAKDLVEKAYIFVGRSRKMTDGGLTYTIDLGKFYAKYRLTNKRILMGTNKALYQL